ncbi:MAG: FAD-dependent oxidoreductase [Desulfobacterales bacterium]|jgi:prolycopene isomerase|nr:FAD-dependent oxidoreductase [Desulfobacterales bacterium]
MPEKYDAIIIGSGIGGAAIGALLAHAGRNVVVLEKNKLPGGRCISYDRDGYLLDLGWHFFCLAEKGPLGEICNRIGMPGIIPWNTVKNTYLQIGEVVEKYTKKAMFAAVPEPDRGQLEKLFTKVFTITDEELEKLWYVPVEQWVHSFTKNAMANTIIDSFVCQYFCIPSTVASTAEFIRAFRDVMVAKASAYPDGGNTAVPTAYLSAMEKLGGTLKTNAGVKKIIVENNTAVGVVCEDGTEYRAPLIISNADISVTVLDLVGESHFPGDYVAKIKGLTYSIQGVVLRMVLSEKVTDKQCVIYIPDENSPPLKVTDQMKRGEVPDLVAGCYGSPTNFDPSMAPNGKQLLTSLHGCPPDITDNLDRWKEALVNSHMKVFPEAKGKVEKVWIDPPKLVNAFAGEGGNIIGVAQTVDQIHERRPSVVSPLKGLYFSSAEAGGHGIGTELAANSALELFEILKN